MYLVCIAHSSVQFSLVVKRTLHWNAPFSLLQFALHASVPYLYWLKCDLGLSIHLSAFHCCVLYCLPFGCAITSVSNLNRQTLSSYIAFIVLLQFHLCTQQAYAIEQCECASKWMHVNSQLKFTTTASVCVVLCCLFSFPLFSVNNCSCCA